ncbi:MAG: 4-hydroxy-3-methylbut-2-enyl diphosphate reductase [Bacteroidales bacterium]
MLNIEIDSGSGFCYGVIRAVEKAEINLREKAEGNPGQKPQLYSLGSIVHNNSELERLHKIGLTVIDTPRMEQLHDTTVLIRAHGEPPTTYSIAAERNITLIDCTCPVVLKLQERIRETYKAIHALPNTYQASKGQIVIFGKTGHAEVNGLVGQVHGDAVIVDLPGKREFSEKADDHSIGMDKIDFLRPIHIFSQTTKDPIEYEQICQIIQERIMEAGGNIENLKVHNTICKQVAQRHTNLVNFARTHSVIIFVSGRESSNGKVLYDLCKSVNSRSYHIQNVTQIQSGWFTDGDSVGICGATSTPKWQLEGVQEYLRRETHR